PEVRSFIVQVGGGGPGGGGSANNSRLPVQLRPRAQRTRTAQQIARQIRSQIMRFPGFRAFTGLPPSLQIGGRQGNQNYSLMMQALGTHEVYARGPEIEGAVTAGGEGGSGGSNDLGQKRPRILLGMEPAK